MRRIGDRKDGKLLREIDAIHFIMPALCPNRTDNEAFVSDKVCLDKINNFLDLKNSDNPEFKYTLFQVVTTILLKVIVLRPKMNYFISNKKLYERNEISAAFTVKKEMSDNGGEAAAFIRVNKDDNFETVHNKMVDIINRAKSDADSSSMNSINVLNIIPRFISYAIIFVCKFLDKHGKVPKFIVDADPSYSSVFIANLGSIKLKAGYHHLNNWGTNSFFCVIGEKGLMPYYDNKGNCTMKESLEIGLTIDERIADGYYFSKSIALAKYLFEHPEELEFPLSNEVFYEQE